MRYTAAALAVAAAWTGAAHAQGSVDPALVAQGQALYEQNCAVCHRAEGRGRTPVFPALAGNEVLADHYLLVSKVYQGLGAMPPFPTLGPAEITAVAAYVNNSWGNSFGAPTQSEVEAVMAEFDPPGETRTIWDGVYTAAQAEQGKKVFSSPCGICHGSRLNGAPDDQDMVPAPPLAREKFLRAWDGRSLGALFTYTSATMPMSNPGFLPPEDYAAIIAHMLATTGAPAGETPLPTDVWDLAHIQIGPKP